MCEEEIVTNYLEKLQNEMQFKDIDEIKQSTYELIDLLQMLLEKITILSNEKQELKYEYEQQCQNMKNELLFNQQLLNQMKRIHEELLEKQDLLYEKIIQLEEDQKQALITISIQQNQLEILQDNALKRKIDFSLEDYNQMTIENHHYVQQINSLKQIIQNIRNDQIQQLQQNQQIVNHLEDQIKNLKSEIIKIKSDQQNKIQQFENINFNNNIIRDSALKDITNTNNYYQFSNQHKSLIKEQKNLKNCFSSQQRYLEHDELFDVNQFTVLESELQDTNFNTFINVEEYQNTNENQQIDKYQKMIFQRNIYKDFFNLTSQSVKLNLNDDRLFDIKVNHLYEECIEKKIPFHKWYQEIYQYLKALY